MVKDNVIPLNPKERTISKSTYILNNEGDNNMNNDNFVSKDEMKNFEEKFDLKLKVAIQPLEGKVDNINQKIDMKFDNMEQTIENMFLKQESKIREQKNSNIKWTIGTAIATIGILIPVIMNFIS